ncbi:Aldolase-type TIM barrel [Penicillium angulare]|uniref:Aldolase-type TIM barrel n=1 Tax=Penicillium angulare TaxID=116970 RepID=UPI002541F1A9|nr:Aldolase-type TIM barrel [Penicillium angulare]KAJ5272816.1 Aldolase-type TIM barrel [Penicillium angulare]
MFGFAEYSLAAAVTKAGGLGFIGGGFDFTTESAQLTSLNNQLEKARSELGDIPSTGNLPIGVGFITFQPAGFIENAIPILRKHRVVAVWLSFPESDEDHLPIIDAIRQARTQSNWDVRIFVQVGTVQAARNATQQSADVIVVQGSDAGGHQWAQGASLLSLLPEVRDAIEDSEAASRTAILAAGGIVDGRGCVAALGLGADGVVMGTRFIVTAECPAPSHFKETILSSNDGGVSTVKSTQHDVFQSTDVFPRQYDGRAIIGISYKEAESGLSQEEIIKRYKNATEQKEDYRRTVWAGASVGVINELLTVSDLIKNVQKEVKSTLDRVARRI